MTSTTRTGLLALALLCSPALLQAQEARSLAFGVGIFDTAAWFDDKGDFDAVEAGVQIRWPATRLLGIGGIAGVSANDDSAVWLYAGGRRPFRPWERWSVSPGFAVTYYEKGDGKDLGDELEFRSSIELAFHFDSGSTLGLELYHLSNASISDVNPGSNSLVLLYSQPW